MNEKVCRDELYQKLSLLLMEQGCTAEIKNRLYIILSAYEITSRTTEIALLEEDRNAYLLKKFIIAKTVKGKGVSFMENQAGWHGKAPNEEEYKIAIQELQQV